MTLRGFVGDTALAEELVVLDGFHDPGGALQVGDRLEQRRAGRDATRGASSPAGSTRHAASRSRRRATNKRIRIAGVEAMKKISFVFLFVLLASVFCKASRSSRRNFSSP